MNTFFIKTLARHEKNVAKWGHQDLNTLIIATGEEFGELCKASLGNEGESHDIKKECIDLAALLVEIYEWFGGEQSPLSDGEVNALHSRIHVAAPNAAPVIVCRDCGEHITLNGSSSVVHKCPALNVSCITCKHGPRVKGEVVDSCGKYAMADQCYDHGFGGYEVG
jgi:NTP pyrophosphatase (non-canonical NTP hydrolase)